MLLRTAADKMAYFEYVAVATDEGKVVLGKRDILVSWRDILETGSQCSQFGGLPAQGCRGSRKLRIQTGRSWF
ncbi:hypothetical protein V6N13_023614 [Hibiscus sabdariffa]